MMKSLIRGVVVRSLLALLVFSAAQQALAHSPRPRVTVFAGPVWSPFWFPPVWHYPPPIIVAPPPAPPPVYIEQTPPPAAVPAYWYFCPSSKVYYPTVSSCPEAWVAVPANPDD